MSSLADRIVESMEHDPPERVGDHHPKLFSDIEMNTCVDEMQFELWQQGIIKASWDEDEEATVVSLTDFGYELLATGQVRPYLKALDNDIELDDEPRMLVDPEDLV